MGLDIRAIIDQLVKVCEVSGRDIEPREESPRYLTPISKVSEGGPTHYDPNFPIRVIMDTPKGSKFIYSDLVTYIDSKELYLFYRKLSKEEFRNRLNKTLYDYVRKQLEKDRKENVPDSENIWIQPNAAFVNWFHEEPGDINFIESFISPGDTKDGIPIFLSKWAKEVVRLLLKNGEMKHQDIILALKDLPPSYNHISKIFKISKAREFLQSEIVNNRSYYSLKNPTKFKK